ncbi:hypothetical protein B9Z19DRAFT_704291 [Tuber borchii]|uniref:Uncharacterized protein n=1 Tax=Tuber borchii TaxID=42251 RepID=A0A2T6Z9X8_TUBBO|nr:hypothetical protein B9Z19DRAFT_704291 [Tuber borchii]
MWKGELLACILLLYKVPLIPLSADKEYTTRQQHNNTHIYCFYWAKFYLLLLFLVS